MTTRDKREPRIKQVRLVSQQEFESKLRPIVPIGSRIIDHPKLAEWTKQGYVRQEADGLWLHYVAVCSLLSELRKELEEAKGKLAKYGVHQRNCNVFKTESCPERYFPCTCGLAADHFVPS